MIKNILVDWFEVQSNGMYGVGEMGRLVQKVGLSREEYMHKDSDRFDLLNKLNRGQITEKRYWKGVLERTGWNVTVEQMMGLVDEAVRIPIPGTFDVLNNLHKQGYNLILVSDLGFELKERILDYYPWINQLFSGKYFSCDHDRIKSDPGCFEFIIEQEGINPDASIFIDDYDKNVARATEAGITGVLFQGAVQLKATLTEMGIYNNPVSTRVS